MRRGYGGVVLCFGVSGFFCFGEFGNGCFFLENFSVLVDRFRGDSFRRGVI